jgi:parallel beta-helix repeat protein
LDGISLYSSKENVFTNNYVYANEDSGIFLNDLTDRNNFSRNLILNNHGSGFWIQRSNYNLITENLFLNNKGGGMTLEFDSNYNIVSFNDFTNNSIPISPQAADNYLNSTNVFVYNYWNEWISPDVDSDGIVDNPYPIDYNQDSYPLTGLDLNLPHLVLAPRILSPKENELFNGTVYINWTLSVDSHKHTVRYNLSYSFDNGKTWIEIESKLIHHYYQWDTTTFPYGTNYLIRVVAYCDDGCSSSGSIGTLTIQSEVKDPNFLATQMIFAFLLAVCSIAAGYYLVNTKFKDPSFIEYFQSDKIEFLKPIYHKVIIGLESIQTAIMSKAVVTPLLEEPTMPTRLVTWFPDDYRRELKTKLKGRTILTLIEIAFQYSEDANLTKLAQALDIPTSTLSDELKKLIKLNYLDFHVTPQVLHDGRYRHYIITSKGVSFLKILKNALELSIRRAKEKEQFV